MRTRIIALIVVCGLLALGAWFVRSRNVPVVEEPVSRPPVVTSGFDTPSTSPTTTPSPQRATGQNAVPATSPGMTTTDNPIPNATAPRTAGGGVPTMPGTIPKMAPAPLVSETPSAPESAPGVPPEEVAIAMDKISLSLRDYRTVMKGNPVGTNKEITEALSGDNPKQARLMPEGHQLNGNGELVDRWGTPYFFHQLSKNDMEIRSAGPDKSLWTPDDIVTK